MFTKRQLEIINIIQQYYQEHGVSPRALDVGIKNSAKRTFGSWNNALDAAQIPVNRRYGHERRFNKIQKSCIVCEADITNTRFQKYCSKCGDTSNNRNTTLLQRTKGLNRKLAAIQTKGGCCEICGYNRNIAALVFHHIKDKNFGLDIRAFSNRRQEVLNRELDKCQLLCQNCHAEIHNPDLMGMVGIEPTTA